MQIAPKKRRELGCVGLLLLLLLLLQNHDWISGLRMLLLCRLVEGAEFMLSKAPELKLSEAAELVLSEALER